MVGDSGDRHLVLVVAICQSGVVVLVQFSLFHCLHVCLVLCGTMGVFFRATFTCRVGHSAECICHRVFFAREIKHLEAKTSEIFMPPAAASCSA